MSPPAHRMHILVKQMCPMALLPGLSVSRLQMWQMMMMTSMIRAGPSGLSLRKASSAGGEGGARATGSGKGRYWVNILVEECARGAVDAAKAAWWKRTVPSASTAWISPSSGGQTPRGSAACEWSRFALLSFTWKSWPSYTDKPLMKFYRMLKRHLNYLPTLTLKELAV